MKRTIDQTGTVLSTLVAAVLFVLCIAFVYLRVAGLSPFVVTGASMEPAIAKGSLIFVEPAMPAEIRLGDVITFTRYDQLTTHRVTDIQPTSAGLSFRTKGDANAVADPEPIVFPGQVGVVRGAVPLVGYPVGYLQSYWRMALTIIAALVFFGAGAMMIFRRETPAAAAMPVLASPVLRPRPVRVQIIDAEELWRAHLQWVRESTARQIRAA